MMFNLAADPADELLGFTMQWVTAIASRVRSVHVITMRAGTDLDLPSNVRVHSLGKESGASEPRRVVTFYRHLSAILAKERIDVCFAHMIPLFVLLAGPVLKARSVPIVMWYAHPSRTRTLRAAHVFADQVVTSLASSYPHKKDKVKVIGQGIDTDLFSPSVTLHEENPPMLLCAGRLSLVKDHVTLLRTTRRLLDGGRKVRTVIVGKPLTQADEGYERKLKRLTIELDIQDHVEFVDAVPLSELPGWYGRCSVHVNLTGAGFGDKVIWESMACAKPCLVANPDLRPTLGRYADRLLFDRGDPDDLAKKVDALLELSQTERGEIGLYLRERVVELHSLGRLADVLVDVLRSGAARGNTRAAV